MQKKGINSTELCDSSQEANIDSTFGKTFRFSQLPKGCPGLRVQMGREPPEIEDHCGRLHASVGFGRSASTFPSNSKPPLCAAPIDTFITVPVAQIVSV